MPKSKTTKNKTKLINAKSEAESINGAKAKNKAEPKNDTAKT